RVPARRSSAAADRSRRSAPAERDRRTREWWNAPAPEAGPARAGRRAAGRGSKSSECDPVSSNFPSSRSSHAGGAERAAPRRLFSSKRWEGIDRKVRPGTRIRAHAGGFNTGGRTVESKSAAAPAGSGGRPGNRLGTHGAFIPGGGSIEMPTRHLLAFREIRGEESEASMNVTDHKQIDALVSLLADEDPKIHAMVVEHLL